MCSYGFQHDLRQGLLTIRSGKLALNVTVRTISAGDMDIDGRSELFIEVKYTIFSSEEHSRKSGNSNIEIG